MKNVVFEVSSWGRSRDGATEHRQYVTSDKEYFVNNNSMKTISDDEYGKVIKFIQEKMLGHSYKSDTIYDYGFSVKAIFEGNEISVSNVEPLYEEARLLFKEISGEIVTAEDLSKLENTYKKYNYYLVKNELIENSVLYLEKRSTGMKFGESLKIVTNDKLLYTASINCENILPELPDYDIKKIRVLSDDEYDKIINYIQKHIIGKQYRIEKVIRATTFGVYARYNYYSFGNFNNVKLYKKTDRFLHKKIKFD